MNSSAKQVTNASAKTICVMVTKIVAMGAMKKRTLMDRAMQKQIVHNLATMAFDVTISNAYEKYCSVMVFRIVQMAWMKKVKIVSIKHARKLNFVVTIQDHVYRKHGNVMACQIVSIIRMNKIVANALNLHAKIPYVYYLKKSVMASMIVAIIQTNQIVRIIVSKMSSTVRSKVV